MQQSGSLDTHLLVENRLGLTTISCLLSVVPPLSCRWFMMRNGLLQKEPHMHTSVTYLGHTN